VTASYILSAKDFLQNGNDAKPDLIQVQKTVFACFIVCSENKPFVPDYGYYL